MSYKIYNEKQNNPIPIIKYESDLNTGKNQPKIGAKTMNINIDDNVPPKYKYDLEVSIYIYIYNMI